MKSFLAILFEILFPSHFSIKNILYIPTAPPFPDRSIFCLYDYHHPLGKKLIYSIKKYNNEILSNHIADHMYQELIPFLAEEQSFGYFHHPLVIPVPMTKKQYIKRGFNQNATTAKILSKKLLGQYHPECIQKIRETKKQALIAQRSLRFKNVRNCFGIPKQYQAMFHNKDIIIVDDLITTGATLGELKKLCERYGARKVIAVTVAH